MRGPRGRTGAPNHPPTLQNHNAIGFVSIPGKLKMLDHHRLASVHFKWYLDAFSSTKNSCQELDPSDPLSGSAHGSDDSKE